MGLVITSIGFAIDELHERDDKDSSTNESFFWAFAIIVQIGDLMQLPAAPGKLDVVDKPRNSDRH